MLYRAIVVVLVSSASMFAAPGTKKLPTHCDKACLTSTVDNYLAALVAHDPSLVPLSPNLEFVQDNV